MTSEKDAPDLPAPMDSPGTDSPADAVRSWDHIGAIIVDAALQRRQNYHETVRPRVVSLIAEWPDAATTSGFRRHLETGALADVISWPSPGRLAQVDDMTCVFESQGIETMEELRATLGDEAKRTAFREALAGVRHVNPKTLDYLEVLSEVPADANANADADADAGAE